MTGVNPNEHQGWWRNDMLTKCLVWLARIIVGGTFVFSGFAKAVDPWGTMYKISDYLSVWGVDVVPRQGIFIVGIALATLEFVSGAMLLLGCMRRSISGVVAVIMAFMLPLTVYIFIADPVSDCGCFGDAYVISNAATMVKNIVLTALIIYLLYNNQKATYLYPPLEQWIVAIACVAYCILISIVGVTTQPIVDFRPYPVGQKLVSESDDDEPLMLYQRDSVTQAFDIYDLPDSTWTFVGRQERPKTVSAKHFVIMDGDDDVTNEVIAEDGPQMLYVITNPLRHNRSRASMANRINERITSQGGSMVALVAATPQGVEKWKESTSPAFDVYGCDDTQLKELVRGDAALVYLKDGVVQWKRNLMAFSSNFPRDNQAFEDVYVVDDGSLIKQFTLGLMAILVILFIFGIPGWNRWWKKQNKIEENQ